MTVLIPFNSSQFDVGIDEVITHGFTYKFALIGQTQSIQQVQW